MSSTFATLGLNPQLQETLQTLGYKQPTPIQAQAIEPAMAGQDLIAEAQTGTGKTAAFALPLLHRFNAQPTAEKIRPVRALVLVPTRELAIQVKESFFEYGKDQGVRTVAVFGGVRMDTQMHQMRRGTDVLVATPGRLLDLISQGEISLAEVETLVLDEADRMLDLGFINDINQLVKRIPKDRQTWLFSATFGPAVEKLARELTREPQWLKATKRNSTAQNVQQTAYAVNNSDKAEALTAMVQNGSWKQLMVFTRTKKRADMVTEHLQHAGISAAAIHGDKKQRDRMQALEQFKAGRIRILVATDVAARGLDIDALPRVVNYDVPQQAEAYVHRIGRTGRAGSSGQAITLVSQDERSYLADIEVLIKRPLKLKPLPALKDEHGNLLHFEDAMPGKNARAAKQRHGAQKTPAGTRPKQKQGRQPEAPAEPEPPRKPGIRPSLMSAPKKGATKPARKR